MHGPNGTRRRSTTEERPSGRYRRGTSKSSSNRGLSPPCSSSVSWIVVTSSCSCDVAAVVARRPTSPSPSPAATYDHPTDTLLPGATIGLNKVTGQSRRLVSRRSKADQAPGVYSMELGRDGVVRMLWNSSVPYWSSGGYFSSVPEMTGHLRFSFTFVDDGREMSFAYHALDASATTTVYSTASSMCPGRGRCSPGTRPSRTGSRCSPIPTRSARCTRCVAPWETVLRDVHPFIAYYLN